MPKQQDYGDKDPDALADYEGLEQWLPSIWLEGEIEEQEGHGLDGHIWLFRDFRCSGDPAVLISKTLEHAPELLEMLANMSQQTSYLLDRYGYTMHNTTFQGLRQMTDKAQELVAKLKAFEPVDMPAYGDDELDGELDDA